MPTFNLLNLSLAGWPQTPRQSQPTEQWWWTIACAYEEVVYLSIKGITCCLQQLWVIIHRKRSFIRRKCQKSPIRLKLYSFTGQERWPTVDWDSLNMTCIAANIRISLYIFISNETSCLKVMIVLNRFFFLAVTYLALSFNLRLSA